MLSNEMIVQLRWSWEMVSQPLRDQANVHLGEDSFDCHISGADAAGIQEAESRDVCCFTSYKA